MVERSLQCWHIGEKRCAKDAARTGCVTAAELVVLWQNPGWRYVNWVASIKYHLNCALIYMCLHCKSNMRVVSSMFFNALQRKKSCSVNIFFGQVEAGDIFWTFPCKRVCYHCDLEDALSNSDGLRRISHSRCLDRMSLDKNMLMIQKSLSRDVKPQKRNHNEPPSFPIYGLI